MDLFAYYLIHARGILLLNLLYFKTCILLEVNLGGRYRGSLDVLFGSGFFFKNLLIKRPLGPQLINNSRRIFKKSGTLGSRTVIPRLVLSSDQCSQKNFPNPHLVLFWSLIQRFFPQISALFWPISNSAPSISALFLLAQKERCPRTQCILIT